MAAYDHTKHLCKEYNAPFGLGEEGSALHMFAGFFSGVAFATASAPVDIIKNRIMADQEGRYKHSLDCFIKLLKKDGPMTFYRGWTPSVTRLAPLFVFVSPVMEQMRVAFGLGYF